MENLRDQIRKPEKHGKQSKTWKANENYGKPWGVIEKLWKT